MPSAAPGIEEVEKYERYEGGELQYEYVDGQWRQVREEGDIGGDMLIVQYVLDIDAVDEMVAERKGRAYATLRHPADALSMSSRVQEALPSESGLFGSAGPRELYRVSVEVERR
jgi:hypothetical protein